MDSSGGRPGRAEFAKLDTMTQRVAILCLAFACALTPYHAFAVPLTKEEAIARVQRETGGKVLTAETKQVGKRIIYRIKVLTHDGQVRIVEVTAGE